MPCAACSGPTTRPGLDGKPLGLVHGDFSPHNILVGTDGSARLTDFGSARLTALAEDRAEGGSPLGKPSYMSPEQLQGETIDHRTDIFSVGVALWTALTGQKLFTDPSYEKTVMNVLRKKIPQPSSLGAPAALDQVCLRALSRTPGGRYASAEEMAQDLLQAAGGAHLVANPHQVGRWVQQSVGDVLAERRRRVLAATSAAPTPVRKSRGGDTMVMDIVAPAARAPRRRCRCRPAVQQIPPGGGDHRSGPEHRSRAAISPSGRPSPRACSWCWWRRWRRCSRRRWPRPGPTPTSIDPTSRAPRRPPELARGLPEVCMKLLDRHPELQDGGHDA